MFSRSVLVEFVPEDLNFGADNYVPALIRVPRVPLKGEEVNFNRRRYLVSNVVFEVICEYTPYYMGSTKFRYKGTRVFLKGIC